VYSYELIAFLVQLLKIQYFWEDIMTPTFLLHTHPNFHRCGSLCTDGNQVLVALQVSVFMELHPIT
jgi:hypothetical protein